ncbi:N-acetylglutamate synthase, mitochondrial [Acipenser oxyrinchus oxyrinchus]|uniref:N-acetylglutamate synthase, mitochondrial n=1 Tax=Acipenser oxyrinchus oxyrinchus TaxID=40147 RepID=A0AAD8D0U5_ACIOX|nr:N-acetylglutamate synthase, mitochondrial [Acipenser oxyrinchus oxyrinchus]
MANVNPGSTSSRAVAMASHLLSKPTVRTQQAHLGRCVPKLRRQMSDLVVGGCSGNISLALPDEDKPSAGRVLASSRSLIHRDVKAFLNQLGGDPREARYWLTQFQKCSASQSPAFAVMEVDEEVFGSKAAVHSLAFGLSFLQRMDMKPVVVMGLPEKEAETLSSARTRLVQNCRSLIEALQENSVSVMPFFGGAPLLRVGETPSAPSSRCERPIEVDADLLQWSLNIGNIPIVCPVGETASGQSVLLDSLAVTATISKTLKPLKVMFLNNIGGICNKSHKVLGKVSLPADMELLQRADWINPKDQRRAWLIVDLLNHMPTESSAVITSASTILAELFSHKGSGTMFKNAKPVRRYNSLDEVDIDRLLSLINKSFGKNLKGDYIVSLQDRLHSIYLSECYTVAAILTKEPVKSGTLYLDKFVVSSSRQGQGASQMLWECIQQEVTSLFWRSQASNRINPWYFKQCDGSFVKGKWIVFWYGLSDIRDSYDLVDYAKNMPESFNIPATGGPAELILPEHCAN